MKRAKSAGVNLVFAPLLLLCSLARVTWAAAPPTIAPIPRLQAAAQDGAGTVWALPDDGNGSDQSQSGKIYRWQAGGRAAGQQTAGTWVEQVVPGAAGFHAAVIAHGDDGSVYALWQKRDPGWYPWQAQTKPVSCLITVQRGIRVRVQSRFTAALPVQGPFSGPLKLYAGKGGDAWIVSDASPLVHVAPDGTVQSFPVTPDQVFGGKFVNIFAPQVFGSSVDPLGRRWFWQESRAFGQPGTLRGFLIWDGKTLNYQPTLPGLPDRSFGTVAPHGGRFLWAVQNRGSYPYDFKLPSRVYKIDTRTLTAAEAALPPELVALAPKHTQSSSFTPTITRIFWLQGDLCVLTIDYSGFISPRLWRRHGTAWRKEPDAFAASQYNFGDQAASAFNAVLDTPQGTWLAVNGAGIDWLPAGGKGAVWDEAPVRVNWRRGLAAGRVSALFRLPDGSVMPFPYYGSGAILPPLPPPLLPLRPGITLGTPGQPSGMGDMLADQRHHLWGLAYLNQAQALEEWDGRQWHAHPVPKVKSVLPSASLYACDARGRIWITIQIWNPPAQPHPVDGRLVYDPAHDSWAQYDTVPEALAAAAEPGMAFLPSRNASSLPVFSGDGRAAYTDNQMVFLYDGKAWRQWKTHDIQPRYPDGNAPDKPRFEEDGHLEVAIENHLYDWTAGTGWLPNGIAPPDNSTPPLPPGGPPNFWGQPVRDNAGGGWVASGGAVYLTRYGLWRKQAVLSGAGSPFFDGRSLQNVLQDPKGRYFFETVPGGLYEYVVWTPPAALLPAPRIQIAPLSADSVRLRFQPAQDEMAAGNGPPQVQWRLNGGEWSALPTGGGPVTLTALKPGTYHVEAQAISSLLQASPAPSAAVFTVQPPTAAQIAGWVQTLRAGTDNARELAVTGLIKAPDAALPALQAARPGASEAGQWWIDAAMQQVQSAKPQSAKPQSAKPQSAKPQSAKSQYPDTPAAVQPE